MDDSNRLRNAIATLVGLALLAGALWLVEASASVKLVQATALFAIWGIAAVSLNLINGVTGILSLGHHGFMLIGGYATALLVLSDDGRQRIASSARSQMTDFTLGLSVSNWFQALGLEAWTTPDTLWIRFIVALFIGGVMAAIFGLIVGIPSLRLRGDYLAIVTFGFGEIVRLLASTSLFAPFTNGSLGFSGVPSEFGKSVWWTFLFLVITVYVLSKLKFSSYGRALMGIREDEIAAEAMGVNLAYHKVFAFTLSAFFAGIAGGLWVSWLATARLDVFLFFLTFFFLVAISVGGTGSITGVLFGTALVVFVQQYGDPLEQSYSLPVWFGILGAVFVATAIGVFLYRRSRRMRPRMHWSAWVVGGLGMIGLLTALVGPAIPALDADFRPFGMRRILLSALLLAIMIARPEGLLGRAEFSWAWLFRERKDQPTDEERAQDAWLSNPELRKRLDDPKPGAHPIAETGERPEGERATGEETPLEREDVDPPESGGR